ncbi:MAG TPA: hypothetical protein VKF80_04265 [Candidatus Eisenbacteria bacterium]|nr:hypothetical protein [Candidatus Eisenbacteria bacterium]
MTDLRSRLIAAIGVLSLIAFQPGERPSHDPRFISPSAPVNSFWAAIREGQHGRALECFVGVGRQAPGEHLVDLPPLQALDVQKITVTHTGTGKAVVRYQVHYQLRGGEARAFASADEVMLVRGEWRILRPMTAERKDLPVPQVQRPKPHVAPGPGWAMATPGGSISMPGGATSAPAPLTGREGAC